MMDTVQLVLELPRDIFSALRLVAAVKWYEMEQVSQAKAAEIAGLSRAEFLAAPGKFGVTPFQITAEE